jgi:hypothetical protein
VSNASTLAYPILDDGCVDAGFNYTAPPRPGRTGAGGYSGSERTFGGAGMGVISAVCVCGMILAWFGLGSIF